MNILLTSAGRRSYLVRYFREALADNGLVHVGNSEPSIATQCGDVAVITPFIYDSNYIPFLKEYCRTHSIGAILSLFDVDLPVLAAHQEEFSAIDVRVVLAPRQTVALCNDKWKADCWLRKHNFETARTFIDLAAAKRAITAGELSYPVVVKPRWGMGSIGVNFAANERELDVFYEKSRHSAMDTYLRFESAQTPGEAVLVQERLTGQEYGLDLVNDLAGNYVTTFAKAKLAMRAGETDVGLTVDPTPFSEVGRRLSTLLRHQAVMSVDCFYDGQTVKIGELNCRISGHYPVAHLAGANLPKQIVRWLHGQGTDPGLVQIRTGVRVTKELVPAVMPD